MTLLMALTRWAHLLPLMAIFGASAFLLLLRQNKHDIEYDSRQWLVAAFGAGISALIQFVLSTASIAGEIDLHSFSVVLEHTRFGEIFVVRAVALIALVLIAIPRQSNLLATATLSAIALSALAFTSHAAAEGRADYANWRALNDALHLLMGGFWIGGLVVLLQRALDTNAKGSLGIEVGIFSEWAIYAVTALILAGMINAAFIYAAQRVSWTYTILLLLKAALAAGMIVLAFINRLRVMPKLDAGLGASTLALNVRNELLLGAGVVGIAAILGSISPS